MDTVEAPLDLRIVMNRLHDGSIDFMIGQRFGAIIGLAIEGWMSGKPKRFLIKKRRPFRELMKRLAKDRQLIAWLCASKSHPRE
jgi:hypothetical protein